MQNCFSMIIQCRKMLLPSYVLTLKALIQNQGSGSVMWVSIIVYPDNI